MEIREKFIHTRSPVGPQFQNCSHRGEFDVEDNHFTWTIKVPGIERSALRVDRFNDELRIFGPRKTHSGETVSVKLDSINLAPEDEVVKVVHELGQLKITIMRNLPHEHFEIIGRDEV